MVLFVVFLAITYMLACTYVKQQRHIADDLNEIVGQDDIAQLEGRPIGHELGTRIVNGDQIRTDDRDQRSRAAHERQISQAWHCHKFVKSERCDSELYTIGGDMMIT